MTYFVEDLLTVGIFVTCIANLALTAATIPSVRAWRFARVLIIGMGVLTVGYVLFVTIMHLWRADWGRQDPRPLSDILINYAIVPGFLVLFVAQLYQLRKSAGSSRRQTVSIKRHAII